MHADRGARDRCDDHRLAATTCGGRRAKGKRNSDQGDGRTPWQRYRQIALGVLGWTPNEFHAATIRDISDGLKGWMEANGHTPQKGEGPMTRSEFEELKAQYGN